MKRLLLLLLIACAAPAYAASLPAGFAPGPVWLSSSAPVGGDTVEIYTVVYDASGTAIEGSVTFLIDDEPVGSAPFTLSPGETEIRSVRWTAVAGTHALAARLDTAIHADSKQEASLENRTTGTTTITVAEPPPPPEEDEEELGKQESVVAALASSPVIGSVLGTALTATESVRLTGEALLASYASSTTPEEDMPGTVLGTSTAKASEKPSPLVSRAAAAGLPLFRYPALFYPFALILFLFILWLVARMLRNPRKKGRR